MSFDLWHTADPDAAGEGGTLEPPADGVYQVTLVDAGAFTAQSSGKAFVKTELKDESTDYSWTVLHGFKSQAQANVTKKTCRTMGVDIDTVASEDALDTAMKALIGQYFTVTVKTNGQYRNTYIDGPAEASGMAPSAPIATDDVPF